MESFHFAVKLCFSGNCAYFNTYGEGNIDQNQCNDSTHLVCPESAYFSKENTNCE